ncbi:uncharacterized protein FFC1_12647 [Fusarium fujikuroi]|nr:uncharacterized protein FFC1_12647 [Fusarium fujikuroi]
MATLGEG